MFHYHMISLLQESNLHHRVNHLITLDFIIQFTEDFRTIFELAPLVLDPISVGDTLLNCHASANHMHLYI